MTKKVNSRIFYETVNLKLCNKEIIACSGLSGLGTHTNESQRNQPAGDKD